MGIIDKTIDQFKRFRKTGTAVAVQDAVHKDIGPSGLQSPSKWGWFNTILESFTGAWQRNIELDGPRNLLAFSAVFACVTGIASDIAKLPIGVMKKTGLVWILDEGAQITKLLRKPNRYQNRIQFVTQYIISKLLSGNVYVLKVRDERGVVVGLYILDPRRVKVLVSESGDIYYELNTDDLSGIGEQNVTVPAREIIHDMMPALWHPLCGTSPIFACGAAATMGNRILQNSMQFFANASRPSGVLTAPGAISDETANRLKTAWDENYSGTKVGKLAVLGDNLKYEAMTIPAVDAQLIEQLKWSVEDVARAFHYPMYKLGGPLPASGNVEAWDQVYYNDCLQILIESLEMCMDQGLGVPENQMIACDLDALLRMDSAGRFEKYSNAIKGGWFAPNEARLKENLKPVEGGDSPMMQQQNWTLAQLANRPPPSDRAAVAPPADPNADGDASPTGDGDDEDDAKARAFLETLFKSVTEGIDKIEPENIHA